MNSVTEVGMNKIEVIDRQYFVVEKERVNNQHESGIQLAWRGACIKELFVRTSKLS